MILNNGKLMKNKLHAGVFAAGALGIAFPVVAERPNVLLIITDDQNTDTVGCYGGAVKTPYIDSIARNGIQFADANVVHTICSPSRYAILTGRYYDNSYSADFRQRYPDGTQSCVDNDMVIEADGMNLASVLKANGYYTGYVGKYHLTDHQLLHTPAQWDAFGLQRYPADADSRIDKETNAKMKANHEWWVKRMKEIGYDFADAIYPANLREAFNEYLNAHNVEWTADAAVRFLNQQKGSEQPFFLCVGTTYPHGPAPEFKKNDKYQYSLDADVQITGEGFVTDRDLSGVLAGETRESVKVFNNVSPVAPTAKWWDAAVGAMIETLKQNGQYENTLIIYLSDHGQNDGGKSTLYDTGTRVPMVMQWPARSTGGIVYSHVVGSIDLTPTVFDACGIAVPENYIIDGVSLLPVFDNPSGIIRDALLMEMGYAHGIKTDGWKYIAVRYPQQIEQMILRGERNPAWKAAKDSVPPAQPYLIMHHQLAQRSSEKNPAYFDRNQLFNLQSDPAERTNIFSDMPEKAAQMKQLLDREMKARLPHRPFGEFGNGADPAAYQHVANIAMPAPEKSAETAESAPADASEVQCTFILPESIKVGVPVEIKMSFTGIPKDGMTAGRGVNGVLMNGKVSGQLMQFPPVKNVRNGTVYTQLVFLENVPENTVAVRFGVNVTPDGKFANRIFNTSSDDIPIIR